MRIRTRTVHPQAQMFHRQIKVFAVAKGLVPSDTDIGCKFSIVINL